MKLEAEGLPELLSQLKGLERKISRKIIKKATVAAAKVVAPEVKRLLPRGTGFLRRSIKVVTKAKKGFATSRIGQEKGRKFNVKKAKGSQITRGGKAAPIWWIERGTKAHTITAPTGKRLVWTAGRGKKATLIFAKSVRIPATKAQMVLARAQRAKKAAMGAAFRDEIQRGIASLNND